MGAEKVVCELTCLSKDSTEGKRLIERSGEIFRTSFLALQRPFPRVRELLECFRKKGISLGIATSGGRDDADKLLAQAGVEDLFDYKVTADDVDRTKPDPDILRVALEKCGVRSADVVLIGDTPYDVQAASSAGIDCIGVRCGGWHTPDLLGAVAIFEDPAEILASLDEPPLAHWFANRPRWAG
jgi:HAD superfamily hydrolase (TIGR01549 family)